MAVYYPRVRYTVSQDKDSRLWYAHKTGFPYVPVMSERGTFHKTKKGALQVAADCMCLSYEEYMQLRKNGNMGGRVI